MTIPTRVPCLLAVLLVAGRTLPAQQTLTLANGDRLTGRLVRIVDSTWVFRYAGSDLRLPTSGVTGLSSAGPVGVRLADQTIGAATIAPAETGLALTFVDGLTRTIRPAELVAVGDPNDLAALRPAALGFFTPITRFWRATGSAGISDKSGNSNARGISLSLDVERKTSRDRLSAGAAVDREASQLPGGQLEETVAKYFGYLRADLYLNQRLFTFVQTQQERDRFQDLDLRSTYSGGFGLQAVSAGKTDLRFWTSAGWSYASFLTNPDEQRPVAAAGWTLAQQAGPATLSWRLEATPSLEDLSDYHFRSAASVSTAIVGGIGLRVGALNEFNNRPQPGIQKHDMLLTTTVTYSIGR